MNISYERCTYCNRRKWLASGCFRKWSKPVECKHLQRNADNNKSLLNKEYSHGERVFPADFSSIKASKFIKFWKNKLFITGSVQTLQRYFGQNNDVDYMSNKSNYSILPPLHQSEPPLEYEASRKEVDFQKQIPKCPHSEGHLVHRGHGQHLSYESCAIYCQLSKHGWYWGGISSSEAEALLAGQHDNVFLVRDSYDSRHILCVSFRCVGRTLHARLRHANGLFSLNNETFVPANRLSEHCAAVQVKSNLFEMPVKLARPLNRFAKLDSLQMICRFVIRQNVPSKIWNQLPLPSFLITYVATGSDYIIPS